MLDKISQNAFDDVPNEIQEINSNLGKYLVTGTLEKYASKFKRPMIDSYIPSDFSLAELCEARSLSIALERWRKDVVS